MGSSKFTNLLLVVCTALLLVNLAIPAMQTPEPPPAPVVTEPMPAWALEDMKKAIEDLRVTMRFQSPAAAAPLADDPDDALVVRIPGRLAEEWGLTAEDVRAVVNALVGAGKSMRSKRPARSNRTAAIATLRNVTSAQAQFQATAKADMDRDGIGEFGSFVELSGASLVRGDQRSGKLNPPVLSGAFRTPHPEKGMVARSGYYFLIYLPDGSGGGIAADAAGFASIDAENAERHWCGYAWPINPEAGTMTYFTSQAGDVLATESKAYRGFTAPLPGAAFKSGGRYSITGVPAIGVEGQDGNVWKPVN